LVYSREKLSGPAIQPTQAMTLDVTGVGSTFPGERLVVTLRL